MGHDKLYEILNLVVEFATLNNQILAVGLCGSWARGSANLDSDIDLIIIVDDKQRYEKTDWLEKLNFEKINRKIENINDEVYGRVWSRHVFLNDKTEIEFSFAEKIWADIENLDEGTYKVVSDGFKIIYDPNLILNRLVQKVMI